MPDNRIQSREQLIEYAFRALGKPVIDINVDWEQASDRLDDALQLFAERHFDGVVIGYLPYTITEEDFEKKYIMTDNIGPPNGVTGDATRQVNDYAFRYIGWSAVCHYVSLGFRHKKQSSLNACSGVITICYSVVSSSTGGIKLVPSHR